MTCTISVSVRLQQQIQKQTSAVLRSGFQSFLKFIMYKQEQKHIWFFQPPVILNYVSEISVMYFLFHICSALSCFHQDAKANKYIPFKMDSVGKPEH